MVLLRAEGPAACVGPNYGVPRIGLPWSESESESGVSTGRTRQRKARVLLHSVGYWVLSMIAASREGGYPLDAAITSRCRGRNVACRGHYPANARKVIMGCFMANLVVRNIDDEIVRALKGRLRVPHYENALNKQIAATALTRGLILVTRNVDGFYCYRGSADQPLRVVVRVVRGVVAVALFGRAFGKQSFQDLWSLAERLCKYSDAPP